MQDGVLYLVQIQRLSCFLFCSMALNLSKSWMGFLHLQYMMKDMKQYIFTGTVLELSHYFTLLKMVQLYLLQNQKGFLNTLALKQSWTKTALMKFWGLGLREYLVRAFLRGYMRLNQAVI